MAKSKAKTKAKTKAKGKPAKREPKAKKSVLMYGSRVKYLRAQKLVEAGKYKTVLDAYKALGGLLKENGGYKEV